MSQSTTKKNRHVLPRRNLSQSPEQWAAQDKAAEDLGFASWADFARWALEQHT